MVTADETITRRVAHLARIELTDQEAATFTTQLQHVLDYMDGLSEVDVTGVEPMAHPLELETPLREDIVQPSPVDAQGKPKVLQSAPETLYDGYKVPPIL